MKAKRRHRQDCRGRIHESFDRMLARDYGIPLPGSRRRGRRALQTSAKAPQTRPSDSADGGKPREP